MRKADELDNISEADNAEVSAFVGRATENDQIGAVGVHVDQETLKRYNEYLRDWRWRMSTFRAIESEQMGRRSRAFPGERVV